MIDEKNDNWSNPNLVWEVEPIEWINPVEWNILLMDWDVKPIEWKPVETEWTNLVEWKPDLITWVEVKG